MTVKSPPATRSDLDFGPDRIPVALVPPQIKRNPMIPVQSIVHQNHRLLPQRCDDEVHEAVVVKVHKGRAPLITQAGEVRTHLVTDVHELLSAHVLEHGVSLFGVSNEIVHITIRGEEILPPVVVVVNEPYAPA